MLLLRRNPVDKCRKKEELSEVLIGEHIIVRVVESSDSEVTLAIMAPQDITIRRAELNQKKLPTQVENNPVIAVSSETTS